MDIVTLPPELERFGRARQGPACGEVWRSRVRPQNLSPHALRDIERAADDIAAGVAGPAFANRFAVAVADAAERAARRPLLGAPKA